MNEMVFRIKGITIRIEYPDTCETPECVLPAEGADIVGCDDGAAAQDARPRSTLGDLKEIDARVFGELTSRKKSSVQIAAAINVTRHQAANSLRRLVSAGKARRSGNKRGTRYALAGGGL